MRLSPRTCREPTPEGRYVRGDDRRASREATLTAAPADDRTAGAADAALAVTRMETLSADLRGCAVLAADGSVLAASGDAGHWSDPAAAFLAAVDAAGGEVAAHAHVATEDGEAFAVRHEGLAMVAVTDRFTLASLMLTDMRMALRDLARGEPGRERRAPDRGPKKGAPAAEDEPEGRAVDPTEAID